MKLFRTHVGVGQERGAGEPQRLDLARAFDALPDGRRGLTRTAIRRLLVGDARYFEMDVGAVQQRPTDSLLIDVVLVLAERGISDRCLTEQHDATTHGGTLVFPVFGALAEFERNLIRECIHARLAAAR